MHEMSIAINIIDIATREAVKAKAKKVNSIDIEIGSLSGVVVEALDFALQIAVKDSILESAEVNIMEICGRAKCNQCSKEFELKDLYEICPLCGSPDITILQGQEMRVKTMNIQ